MQIPPAPALSHQIIRLRNASSSLRVDYYFKFKDKGLQVHGDTVGDHVHSYSNKANQTMSLPIDAARRKTKHKYSNSTNSTNMYECCE